MNNPDINQIFNNPELKDLMGNIFKSINHNIKKNMDDTENEDNLEDITDTFNSNSDSDEEIQYKKDIDIKKKYINKDFSDSTLIDMLLYLFIDRNGNNIADILTDISNNIAENNQLIKNKMETNNTLDLNKMETNNTLDLNNSIDVIELD